MALASALPFLPVLCWSPPRRPADPALDNVVARLFPAWFSDIRLAA